MPTQLLSPRRHRPASATTGISARTVSVTLALQVTTAVKVPRHSVPTFPLPQSSAAPRATAHAMRDTSHPEPPRAWPAREAPTRQRRAQPRAEIVPRTRTPSRRHPRRANRAPQIRLLRAQAATSSPLASASQATIVPPRAVPCATLATTAPEATSRPAQRMQMPQR